MSHRPAQNGREFKEDPTHEAAKRRASAVVSGCIGPRYCDFGLMRRHPFVGDNARGNANRLRTVMPSGKHCRVWDASGQPAEALKGLCSREGWWSRR